MFYLIGIGLNPNQITLEALEAIKKSNQVFIEAYTSQYAEGSIQLLEKKVKKKIKPLFRDGVEEQLSVIVKQAKNKNIALLIVGNPLFATTHDGVIQTCKEKKVKCKVIPGISIQDYIGLTGLSPYKFGRTITIVSPKLNFAPESFFEQLMNNQQQGLHTLCLLDLDVAKKEFMNINQAISLLEKIAEKKLINISELTGIALIGLGNEKGKILSGKLKELKQLSFKIVPQSLIIAGKMNPVEQTQVEEWHGQK